MSLQQLLDDIPPPADRAHAEHDWESIEQGLGFPLPSDYKGIVEAYGMGQFGEFIYVHQPNSSHEFVDLASENDGYLEAFRDLQESGIPVNYRLESPAELICCGREDNGDPIFWHRVESDPDTWPIVVLEARGDGEYRHQGNLSDFLHKALTSEIRVSVFPDD
ncbi:MAG: SMI1/KNR4 family protein, partial [Candidatus Binatia bacterium]